MLDVTADWGNELNKIKTGQPKDDDGAAQARASPLWAQLQTLACQEHPDVWEQPIATAEPLTNPPVVQNLLMLIYLFIFIYITCAISTYHAGWHNKVQQDGMMMCAACGRARRVPAAM